MAASLFGTESVNLRWEHHNIAYSTSALLERIGHYGGAVHQESARRIIAGTSGETGVSIRELSEAEVVRNVARTSAAMPLSDRVFWLGDSHGEVEYVVMPRF